MKGGYFPGTMLTSAFRATETEKMQAPIIDNELWTLIEASLPNPKGRKNEQTADLVFWTGQRSMALASCYAPGSDGTTCRPHWGPARGATCSRCLHQLRESGLLGRASRMLQSMLPRCEPWGRTVNWSKPDGSWATRFEASHPCRRQRRPQGLLQRALLPLRHTSPAHA